MRSLWLWYNKNWRRFTKGSYTYWFGQNNWDAHKRNQILKKLCYNSPSCNFDLLKHELATKQNQIMKNPFDNTIWQQEKWLKTQLGRTVLNRKFAGLASETNMVSVRKQKNINIFSNNDHKKKLPNNIWKIKNE